MKARQAPRRWLLIGAGLALCAAARAAEPPSQVSVRDYGARGDGTTDDTAAFTAAMRAVSVGGTASVPVGNYRIKTHLVVPPGVTLEGVWRIPTAFTQHQGSTLLAVEGAGSETGPAFITLSANATLKGITVFYPNQDPARIVPYPWCVAAGGGDNSSILDCLLVNPYQGVDFGSRASGRHMIRNLYGQPLRRGIWIDKCYDVGRIENVHFWPFWNWDEKSGIREWLWQNGESFVFGRTDWEYVLNTFVFGYRVGYRFTRSADGPTNGNFLGIGADATEIAVLVEATQTPGMLITNGEFVSFGGERPTEVVVKGTHEGVVQFQNCAFWGPSDQIARIAGTGTVSFSNCNFVDWDRHGAGLPAIESFGGNVMVNGCNFVKAAPQLSLRGTARSGIFVANRLGGPLRLSNSARANLQVGLNSAARPEPRPEEEPGAVVVDDSDGPPAVRLTGTWLLTPAGGNYFRGTHWARAGDGQTSAVFRPALPRAGRYRVYVYVGPDVNHDHASNAPVVVASAEGRRTVRIDLRRPRGGWVEVGAFRFAAGRSGSVTLTDAANGNVLADAVKLVPAPPARP